MIEFKIRNALIVIICSTFVSCKPARYAWDARQRHTPQIPIIPFEIRAAYNTPNTDGEQVNCAPQTLNEEATIISTPAPFYDESQSSISYPPPPTPIPSAETLKFENYAPATLHEHNVPLLQAQRLSMISYPSQGSFAAKNPQILYSPNPLPPLRSAAPALAALPAKSDYFRHPIYVSAFEQNGIDNFAAPDTSEYETPTKINPTYTAEEVIINAPPSPPALPPATRYELKQSLKQPSSLPENCDTTIIQSASPSPKPEEIFIPQQQPSNPPPLLTYPEFTYQPEFIPPPASQFPSFAPAIPTFSPQPEKLIIPEPQYPPFPLPQAPPLRLPSPAPENCDTTVIQSASPLPKPEEIFIPQQQFGPPSPPLPYPELTYQPQFVPPPAPSFPSFSPALPAFSPQPENCDTTVVQPASPSPKPEEIFTSQQQFSPPPLPYPEFTYQPQFVPPPAPSIPSFSPALPASSSQPEKIIIPEPQYSPLPPPQAPPPIPAALPLLPLSPSKQVPVNCDPLPAPLPPQAEEVIIQEPPIYQPPPPLPPPIPQAPAFYPLPSPSPLDPATKC